MKITKKKKMVRKRLIPVVTGFKPNSAISFVSKFAWVNRNVSSHYWENTECLNNYVLSEL